MSWAKVCRSRRQSPASRNRRPELRQPESDAGRAGVGVQAFEAVTNAIAPLIAHRVARVCESSLDGSAQARTPPLPARAECQRWSPRAHGPRRISRDRTLPAVPRGRSRSAGRRWQQRVNGAHRAATLLTRDGTLDLDGSVNEAPHAQTGNCEVDVEPSRKSDAADSRKPLSIHAPHPSHEEICTRHAARPSDSCRILNVGACTPNSEMTSKTTATDGANEQTGLLDAHPKSPH